MTTVATKETGRPVTWTGPVIDVDVHANVPNLQALFPYMSQLWIDWCVERGWKGPSGLSAHYPPASARACRPEWRPTDRAAASDVTLLQEHVLDPWGVDRAILTCNYAIDSLRHPDWAAALARAVNDWIVAEWLDRDDRLRASIVVPARDPDAMVAEIERVGDHPGFVQVMLPARADRLWGQRVNHRLFEAIEARGLVAGLHLGGTAEAAPSPTGYASYFVEEYAAEWQSFAVQITSLVSEGVFQKFPDLRVSVLEGGFLWLPVWGWRMNKEWKGLRREVPWLDRPPLDVVREHVRFSTAPIDGGPPALMEKALTWLGDDDLLMFATDYPHTYDDDLEGLLALLPESRRGALMSETARQWYRL
jgi:predicted TIM-barrel fold metal-dependent hydrolase